MIWFFLAFFFKCIVPFFRSRVKVAQYREYHEGVHYETNDSGNIVGFTGAGDQGECPGARTHNKEQHVASFSHIGQEDEGDENGKCGSVKIGGKIDTGIMNTAFTFGISGSDGFGCARIRSSVTFFVVLTVIGILGRPFSFGAGGTDRGAGARPFSGGTRLTYS